MINLRSLVEVCGYITVLGITSAICSLISNGSLYICLLPWVLALIVWFINYTGFFKYSHYGKVNYVHFLRTSEQYRTLSVVQADFDHIENGLKGHVIAHLSAIIPQKYLVDELDNPPNKVIDKDGSLVEIRYFKYKMARLLLEACQDWFPRNGLYVGIKTNELEAPPKTEERRYVLLDIKNTFLPQYNKEVCNSNFVLVCSKDVTFSIKIGDTVLDNVEGYVKIIPEIFNMSITDRIDYLIRYKRLYAHKLEGIDENDANIRNWVGMKALCKRESHIRWKMLIISLNNLINKYFEL